MVNSYKTKKIAILQSNYIPWKGYFDLIASVDEFIVYDDMQFTKNDWRNRNKIKTPNGLQWLSIPVGSDISRTIREVSLPENGWKEKHLRTLTANYSRAPHYAEVMALITPVYLTSEFTTLSSFNRALIELVCHFLGIKTKISNSWDYVLQGGKVEKLVSLCLQAGAEHYVSGLAAKDYLDANLFQQANVSLSWYDYTGYKEHPQLWGDFEHGVSVLDVLFNCGNEARTYMKFSKG